MSMKTRLRDASRRLPAVTHHTVIVGRHHPGSTRSSSPSATIGATERADIAAMPRPCSASAQCRLTELAASGPSGNPSHRSSPRARRHGWGSPLLPINRRPV